MTPTPNDRILALLAVMALLAVPAASPAQEASSPAREPAAGAREADGTATVSLEEAVATAMRNNPALSRSRALVDGARAERLRATGSFLPSLTVGYDLDRTSTGRVDATGQTFTSTNNAAFVNGRVELFSGFRRFRQLESAGRDVAAGEAGVRRARYETILDVKEAFFDAVANRELVRVQEDRVRRQESQLEFVRQRVIRGKATHSDSLRSRVELNDARVALIRARNDARAATFALGRAMGIRGRAEPAAGASLEMPGLPFGRAELTRLALRTSPALEEAEASARAADARTGAARSSYLPTLSLQGGYDWRAESFPPDRPSWSVSLQASYPLFNGFDREADVRRAESQAAAASARRLEEELSVRADVDDVYHQVEAARATVELAEESVALSREDLRVSRERYRMGLATIVDLQAAETGLADAEARLVQRRFEYRIGLARLESLLGRDLADPELAAMARDDTTEAVATGQAGAGSGGDRGGDDGE